MLKGADRGRWTTWTRVDDVDDVDGVDGFGRGDVGWAGV